MIKMSLAIATALLAAGCNDMNGGPAANASADADNAETFVVPADEGGADTEMTPVDGMAADAPKKNVNMTVTISPQGGYVIGDPNAGIKLVEYGSRTCPACGQFGRDALKPLEQTYVASGKVSFEFRDFLIHGAPDLAAAMVGRCGGKEMYFPMLAAMYADQPNALKKFESMGPAEARKLNALKPAAMAAVLAKRGGYDAIAMKAGISQAAIDVCTGDQKQIDTLTRIYNEADPKVVTGTPTFIINGKKLDAVSWPQVEAALKKAGA